MQLAPAATASVLPVPPMRTLRDARTGVERAMATAAVASWSPTSSTPDRLEGAARIARDAAAIIAAASPDGPAQDLAGAAEQARAGAEALDRAAALLRGVDPNADDAAFRYGFVSAAAYDAYDALGRAYLAAGGS